MRSINMWSLIVVALAAVGLVVFVTTPSLVASPSYDYEPSPFHGSADIEVHIPQKLVTKVTVEEKASSRVYVSSKQLETLLSLMRPGRNSSTATL